MYKKAGSWPVIALVTNTLLADSYILIMSGVGIAEKMSEILNMTSRYQQVEVIAALPEILPSSQHNTIALTLHNLLEVGMRAL